MSGWYVTLPEDLAFASLQPFLHPGPVMVIISGPSGVGKDSVIASMRELGYPFRFVVTATDRPPRPSERHGINYYFLSRAEFQRLVAEDGFLEHALVYDQHKGVPKAQVREALSSGCDVVLRLDVQGAATVRREVPQAVTVFVAPPSPEVLLSRLKRRGGDTAEQLQRRLETALREMQRIHEFDYVVVNREGALEEAARQVAAIIQAEKLRVGRTAIVL